MSVERLGLGTAQFGLDYGVANRSGQVGIDEIKRILSLCVENGITTIDTAIAYGSSEKEIGIGGVSDCQVVTKLGSIPKGHPDIERWIVKKVEESLSRLKIEKLYGLLLHKPEELLSVYGKSIFRGLQKVQGLGYVNKIGVSIYDPKIIDELLINYAFDLVQAPFNLVDRRFISGNYHKQLKDLGMEIHVRSVFLQGVLLMKSTQIPKYFRKWDFLWDQWRAWLAANSARPVDTCLAYAIRYPELDKIIVGADSSQQWEAIINSAGADLDVTFPSIGLNDTSLVDPSYWPNKK